MTIGKSTEVLVPFYLAPCDAVIRAEIGECVRALYTNRADAWHMHTSLFPFAFRRMVITPDGQEYGIHPLHHVIVQMQVIGKQIYYRGENGPKRLISVRGVEDALGMGPGALTGDLLFKLALQVTM